ncbi:hypothetical protein SCHPADRAFT_931881 [Schizopora paradoxa]|uniref:F-box domain-containing protein n=1 Tax=Schizopora paradoxa TaxID=27342 RepID=A0A0H2R8X3_9AGAM|nr:hypothetical protein SCHPADRAFT_931881 [Schizopora paradoxa]
MDSASQSSDESESKLVGQDDCPSHVSEVLLALEKSARMPNIYDVEFSKAFEMKNWTAYRNVYGSDKDPFADNENGRVVDPAWVHHLSYSEIEIDVVEEMLTTLLGVTKELRSQFKMSRERIEAAKRFKGIKSLPDELLAKIFQLSVWEMERLGAKRAMQLSQVCRRFRNVALETRALWTALYSLSSQQQTEMLISRAGPNEKFHAFIFFDSFTKLRPIIDSYRPVIPRWKTLTLDYHRWVPNVRAVLGELFGILAMDGARSPKLEELTVNSGEANPHHGCILPGEFQLWAPNLRTLRCSYFIPLISSSMATISTLVIIHEFPSPTRPSPLKTLVELLLKLPNLSVFELEAHDAYMYMNYRDEMPSVTECIKITCFRLQLPNFPLEELSDRGSCIATLMNALRMPSLEELSISIGINDYDQKYSEGTNWSRSLNILSRALLPKHLTHSTRMKSLLFDMWIDTDLPEGDASSSITLNIPFDVIAYTPSVTISSFVQVLFSQRDKVELQHSTSIASERYRLRVLKFAGCEFMKFGEFKGSIQSLESTGIWNGIEEVIIQDCKLLVQKEAKDVVGQKKLRYLDLPTDLRRSHTPRDDDDFR